MLCRAAGLSVFLPAVLFVCGLTGGYFIGVQLFSYVDSRLIARGPEESSPAERSQGTESFAGMYSDALREKERAFEPMPQKYSSCDPVKEQLSADLRRACYQASAKAPRYWKTMDNAEAQAVGLLQRGKFLEVARYLSCQAVDLTWYEAQCESDLMRINSSHLEDIMEFAGEMGLADAHWVREKNTSRPSLGSFIERGSASLFSPVLSQAPLSSNRWSVRSRLVSPSFQLGEPWGSEEQPEEAGTLLLLEQKSDGKIYIAGVPVTGIEFVQKSFLEGERAL